MGNEVEKKNLDCYISGVKSPERSNSESNLVGNLKRGDAARRADAFEGSVPFNQRTDKRR